MLLWHLIALVLWTITGVSSLEVEQEILCEQDGSAKGDNCASSNENRGLLQTNTVRGSIMEIKNLADDTTNLLKPLTRAQFDKYINPGGVDFRDMSQGLLGDCFLLASLVAIAMRRPDIIIKMFTDVELLEGKTPVYTVKFMMNGKETKVAVNDKVPVAKSGKAYFAKGKRGAAWPMILEKAYAKAFGNYQKINGGSGADVFKNVLNCPVTGMTFQRMSAQKLFDKVKEAADNKFIMGAGTAPGCQGIGIHCGHAYVVLAAGQFGKFPQAVKMFNPHGDNKYKGKITGQDQSKGAFWVTAEEFHRHWNSMDIAEVREGAVVSPITLSTETQGLIALEFDMSSNEPFSVQLEWAMWRFYRRWDSGGCEVNPQFTVLVAKKESPAQYKELQKGAFYAKWISNARVTLNGGSGTYVIYVDVKFPVAKSWLKEFVVNVYGPPTTLQVSKTAPADLLRAMGYQSQYQYEYLQMPANIEAEVDVDDDENLENNCARALDRLAKLNNGREIARLGTDPMFPENWHSLTERKGLKCGDAATGAPSVGCEKYDNWGTFRLANECDAFPSIGFDGSCTCSKSGEGRASGKQSGRTWYACIGVQKCQKYVGIRCPPGSGPSAATLAPRPEPPATTPATKPPVTQPPATQPPATQPPATQPPATQPPATQPPATQPPTPAPTPLTYFRLKNKKDWSKNCLDLDVHSKNIIVWECHDGDNQKWAWDGGRLRSKGNSNLCLTMGGRNGDSVKASECGGSADQAIKRGKDETMKTSTECTVDGEVKRCCLDWDNDDPHEVLAWGCHGRVNQKWVQAK